MGSHPPRGTSPLCQILAEASQQKIERLVNICRYCWDSPSSVIPDFVGLYRSDDTSPEARRFREFLRTHEMRFIGGGNTLNFLVSHRDTGENQVLSVKCIADLLTEDTRRVLETDKSISTVFIRRKSELMSNYNLVVTDYFYAGSFEKYFTENRLPLFDMYQQCSENTQKMIVGFQGLQKYGVLFPDGKVTNWMIGESGNLIIADTKSLITIEQIRKLKENLFLPQTPRYTAPEVRSEIQPGQKINIEKLHAYILGANLYEYLTNSRPPIKFDSSSFDTGIFKSIIGQQYQALIANLTQTDPSLRMSLNRAMQELKFIHMLVNESKKPGTNLKNLVDHKAQLLEPIVFKTPLQSTFYHHPKAGDKDRDHKVQVEPQQFPGLKIQYQHLRSDHLKAQILSDFKTQIEQVSDLDDLAKLKQELKSTVEYTVLAKSQGWFAMDGHTGAVKAFERMFEAQEHNIMRATHGPQ